MSSSSRNETDLSQETDDQLMIRMQDGETAAFDAIVLRYRPQLEGFFLKNIRDRQQAEDLAQETLLKVFKQAWDYLPQGKFRGWMYRIGRNLMIDNIRRQSHDALIHAAKGRNKEEDDMISRVVGELRSPDEKASTSEFAGLVDELLAEIPDDQRLTFTLHHYAGLSLPEVARIMDSTTSTAKSRLRLAREKLQDKLSHHGVAGP